MPFKSIKRQLKPVVLQLMPRMYYHRIIRQAKKEYNLNSPLITNRLSVEYDPKGLYPTMYEKIPTFYQEKMREMHFDSHGIPMLRYSNEYIYHPVYIIQFALSEYGFYVSTNETLHFDRAQNIADWLIARQNRENGCWEYPYDYTHELTGCSLKAPWNSAMAQGQAISLLTRVYYVTKQQKYLESAIMATRLLDVPILQNGLASDLCGHAVFEEYPTIPYSFTLNGFMFCALGLYDLTVASNDERAAELWNQAKETMEFMIPLFDGDLMSVYCLSFVSVGNIERHWADAYHPLHIKLLQCFESIMPNATFEFYIKRWAKFIGIKIQK